MREKKFLFVTSGIVLILVGVLSLTATWYLKKSAWAISTNRTITVSAEGKSQLAPDVARVSFAAVTEGDVAAEIQEANGKIIAAAIEYVKGMGVEPKDIQTTGYNLSPRYEYDEKKKKTFISGYTITETVSLRLTDFTKIGALIGGLPSVGINQINSVSFEVSDPDKSLGSAREEAFKRAYAKAAQMARQNKTRLGRVVTFSESQGGIYSPRYFAAESFGKGGIDAMPATLEPGSEELSVSVSVTYELK